ncbi:MAG: ABC transporter permease [Acidobacteriota bacterium]
MSNVIQDLRYALRFFRKSPGFFLLAVGTLAFGIGANAAIFTIVNGVLLHPLPLPSGERIAFLTRSGDVSIPDGVDWRARSRSFESISLFLRTWAFDWSGSGEPERLMGTVADSQFFRVLGVRPVIGRLLEPRDDQPGADRVIVIANGFWKRAFGADRGVIGKRIRLSDHEATIVGVAPPEADFLHDGVELYVPAAVEVPWALQERGTNNFDAIGRLKPGVSIAAARQEMVAITTDLSRQYPRTNARKIVMPILLLDFLVRSIRPALLVLLAAVGLVLLLACLNLASLLLARASVRQPEIALRVALGASRARILRQLVTEGLLLSSIGGALGVALASLAKDALLSVAPGALPRASEIGLDLPVVGFAVLLALVTGVAFGLAPALSIGRTDPALALAGAGRGGEGGPGRHRTLGFVASAEVALACLLLVGAGLLLGSFRRLAGAPLGFAPSQMLTARIVLPESRYSEKGPQTRAFEGIVDQMRRIPGVVSAAYVIGAPLESGGIGGSLKIDKRLEPLPKDRPSARSRPVAGDYFATLRLGVVKGRPLTAADREGTLPVAVVNRQFVRENFPSEDPIGRRILWNGWGADIWMTIVGVAEDVKTADIASPDEAAVYTPYSQRPASWQRFGTLVLRTSGNPAAYGRSLRKAVWAVDPTLTLSGVHTMEESKAAALASRRFSSHLLTAFGVAALLLALQGIAGVLSYSVAQRRREFGIRIALGASARDVFGSVLRRALRLTVAGLAVGLLGALALTRLLSGLLYGITASDPGTYAIAALVVVVTALLACAVPARRATRVDPMIAIRAE